MRFVRQGDAAYRMFCRFCCSITLSPGFCAGRFFFKNVAAKSGVTQRINRLIAGAAFEKDGCFFAADLGRGVVFGEVVTYTAKTGRLKRRLG